MARMHMPGHKGHSILGCEAMDITEVAGADALYEAEGIIARSEAHASELFGTQRTCYSTEGSSQCIRAMLYLARLRAAGEQRPLILAGRNAHKVMILAAALLDLEVRWLWPENADFSLCRCMITRNRLAEELDALAPRVPAAVYVTSPDYLGGELDLGALAAECHDRGIPLLVDNAHGAYLRFLPGHCHPMELGVDLCCDSAHKTLPVLTGGAYLHVGKNAPELFAKRAKEALAFFGSTSPSYLILQSLDLANRALGADYPRRLRLCVEALDALKQRLARAGWRVEVSDPLKLTLAASASGWEGTELAERLRAGGVECEYADPDDVVLMVTPANRAEDFTRIEQSLGINPRTEPLARKSLHVQPLAEACTPREAVLAPRETVPAAQSVGRILAVPMVSCPPAVPVAVSGEVIDENAAEAFEYYGIDTMEVLRKIP